MAKGSIRGANLDAITAMRRRKEEARIKREVENHNREKNAGFNPKDWDNIIHTLNRYRTRQKKRGMRENEITVVQALLAAKRGAFHIDHIIDRMKEVGLIQKGDLKQEHREWGTKYRALLERLRNNKKLVKADKIYKKMRQLERYTWAPRKLIVNRKRHSKYIKKMLGSKKINENKLSKEIEQVLGGKTRPEIKARKITFLVSLYADVLARKKKDPVNWTSGYKQAMLDHYEKIAHHPDVLNSIIELE